MDLAENFAGEGALLVGYGGGVLLIQTLSDTGALSVSFRNRGR